MPQLSKPVSFISCHAYTVFTWHTYSHIIQTIVVSATVLPFRQSAVLSKYTADVTTNMQVMTRKNKKNTRKIQEANNKSFEILELYEDEPIIFHNNSDKKQTTTTNTVSGRPDKRKIMLVIPSR